MNALAVFDLGPALTIDSREVAEMVDKQHKDLLRDIRNYIDFLQDEGER